MKKTSIPPPAPAPVSLSPFPEGWSSLSADSSVHELNALREKKQFSALLAQLLGHDERHLSLADLQRLLQHRRASEDWDMPDHLVTCPICLSLFEALNDEGAGAPDDAVSRFQGLWPASSASRTGLSNAFRWRFRLAALAASLAILATGIHVAAFGVGRSPGRVMEGSATVLAERYVALPANSPLPSRQNIVAETEMKVKLKDGSTITVAPHSRFRVSTSWTGHTTLTLDRGEANLNVVRQSLGRTLSVETPLGSVAVIGTRFRVNSIDTDALVHEQSPGGNGEIRTYLEKVKAVVVAVFEGTVKAGAAHSEVIVHAGYTAVLRGTRAMIELYPSAS